MAPSVAPRSEEESGSGSSSSSVFGPNSDSNADAAVPQVERYIRTYFPSIVFCGILLVVAVELYDPSRLELEWTTITLIVLLLLAPYIRDLKALEVANVGSVTLQDDIESARRTVHRIGAEDDRPRPVDLETADVGTGEYAAGDGPSRDDREHGRDDGTVRREPTLWERVGSSVGTGLDEFGAELREIYEEEYHLLDRNPRVALAKLRMELDVAIRGLLEDAVPERTDRNRLDPEEIVDVLHENGVVDGAFVAAYTEVRSLYTRAIHGDEIRPQDAIELVDLGLVLLRIVASTRSVYRAGDD